MQKTAARALPSLSVRIDLDATRYQPKMHVYFEPEVTEAPPGQGGEQPAPGRRAGLTDKGEVLGTSRNGRVELFAG